MFTVYKFEKTGNGLKERLHIKAFKTSHDRDVFMCSKHNDWNVWKQIDPNTLSYLRVPYPNKTGVYAAAGGQWHNVKSLDPSILAHV